MSGKIPDVAWAAVALGAKVSNVKTALGGAYKDAYIKRHGKAAFDKLVKRERYLKRYKRRGLKG